MAYVNTFISFEYNTEIEKAAGGTYEGWVLTYDSGNGKQFNKAFHKAAMAKTPQLKEKFQALKKGDKFTLVTEKVGNFVTVTDVVAVDVPLEGSAAPAAQPQQRSNSFNDSSIGLQVGNALTNASTLIASGASEFVDLSLLEAAKKIICIGNELRAYVSSNK